MIYYVNWKDFDIHLFSWRKCMFRNIWNWLFNRTKYLADKQYLYKKRHQNDDLNALLTLAMKATDDTKSKNNLDDDILLQLHELRFTATLKGNIELVKIIDSAVGDYCFHCQSYHPNEQPCLMKR